MAHDNPPGTILLAGASRGLGLGLAEEYLSRGWTVIATARDPKSASLAKLHKTHPDKLITEALDITDPASVKALGKRLAGRKLDVLFVVAGIMQDGNALIHEVKPEQIAAEFMTNAYAPLVLAEALLPIVPPPGTIAFMTSKLGSIEDNTSGGNELYRGTKAALNMFAKSFSLRHKNYPVLLMHPGWVKTDMGGSNAPLDIATSVKGMADTIAKHGHKPGIAYLDYAGAKLPW